MDPAGRYHYQNGWNVRAIVAVVVAAVFSVSAVWAPALGFLSGFAWVVGALLGASLFTAVMWNHRPADRAGAPAVAEA